MLIKGRVLSALTLVTVFGLAQSASFAQDGVVLKGGTQTNQVIDGQAGYSAYPAYPQAPKQAPVPKAAPKKLKTGASQTHIQAAVQQQPPPQRPMQAAVQQAAPPGVLPQQFMGQWRVIGARAKVDCQPQYQQGIDGIFTMSNNQMWNIAGAPGSYSMGSDTGVSQVKVMSPNPTTAFIQYQHPIKNTVAQEAIVMQLSADGRSFTGMQRITIRKQGEPQPRAQVQYNLSGTRN